MALKPDREFNEVTDITNYWYESQTSAEKGGVASVVTQGSGVALDDSTNVVSYAANPSGAIAKGLLLQTVSPALSTTRDFINHEAQEARPGDKVTLVRKGWVVTDMIPSGVTPGAGSGAYLAASGMISTAQAAGAPQVGRFETSKDSDGFARVFIDI